MVIFFVHSLTSSSYLFFILVQLSPHLSGLLGDLCDGDSRVLRLDSLATRVQPEHVGTHRPLGTAGIFLLLLGLKERKRVYLNYTFRWHFTLLFKKYTRMFSHTSLRGFLSFFSFTPLPFGGSFLVFGLSLALSSPSSLLSLAEALLSYLSEDWWSKNRAREQKNN